MLDRVGNRLRSLVDERARSACRQWIRRGTESGLQCWLVVIPDDRLQPAILTSKHLELEPLRVDHAEEMVWALDDVQLHNFIGGQPASVEELRGRYAKQVVGHSPDGTQRWLNWVARRYLDGTAVGYVQATVSQEQGHAVADVAWVIGAAYQRRGYAREAAQRMVEWLREIGVDTIVANIHPDHHASNAVARRVGLTPTSELVDGEIRWHG